VTFVAHAATPKGTYSAVITATDGALKRTAPLTVVVKRFGPVDIVLTNVPKYLAPGFSTTIGVGVVPATAGDDLPPLTITAIFVGAAPKTYIVPDGQTSIDAVISSAAPDNFVVGFTVTNRLTGVTLASRTVGILVTSDLAIARTTDVRIIAIGKLGENDATLRGASVPFTMREIVGLPVTFSCTNNIVGMLSSVAGANGQYQLSVDIQLLPFGTYNVTCTPSVAGNASVSVQVISAKYGTAF
jgi:hypothetical protein